jgi:hypothetical protein
MKRLVKRVSVAALCVAAFAPSTIAQQPQIKVDVELVLAVDTSRSMDQSELELQRNGYIQAFREKEVAQAITSGPEGKIAVTFMEWGAPYEQNQLIPWTIIDSEAAARAFADRLEKEDVYGFTRTSISAALLKSVDLVENNNITSYRRVIDVSGDGPNNTGLEVEKARDYAINRGFTINGLPIMLRKVRQFYDIDHLDRYYKQCVIGGPAAFIAPVFDLKQLAATVRKKLVLEIAGNDAPVPGAAPVQYGEIAPAGGVLKAQLKLPTEKMDCLIGEKRVRNGGYYGGGFGNEGGFPPR